MAKKNYRYLKDGSKNPNYVSESSAKKKKITPSTSTSKATTTKKYDSTGKKVANQATSLVDRKPKQSKKNTLLNTLDTWGSAVKNFLSRDTEEKKRVSPVASKYDAQFTPEYFEKNNAGIKEWQNDSFDKSNTKSRAEQLDVVRKVQAGLRYRFDNGIRDEDDNADPDAMYAFNNSANTFRQQKDLQTMLKGASEQEIREIIDDWQKRIDEAGEGFYKSSTQADLDAVKEYAKKNFTSFANEEMNRIGGEMAKLNIEKKHASVAYDSDLLAAANDALEAGRTGYNLYDYVGNRSDLREAVGFDELEAQYEDLDDFTDALRAKLETIAGAETAMQNKTNTDVLGYQQQPEALDKDMQAAQGVRDNLLTRDEYNRILENNGLVTAGQNFEKGVKDYTAGEWYQNTTTGGMGETIITDQGFAANYATLDQIVKNPQQVLAENAKLETSDPDAAQKADLAAVMTPEEKAKYWALRAGPDGEQRAAEYFAWLEKNGTGQRRAEAALQGYKEQAKADPIGASVSSLWMNALGGLTTKAQQIKGMLGMEVDPYSPALDYTKGAQGIRETVGEEIAKQWDWEIPGLKVNAGNFLYQTFMSGGDMLVSLGVGAFAGGGAATDAGKAITRFVMSSGAAASTFNEALESGIDPTTAAWQAAAAGAVENITEKYSLDALFKDVNPDSFKSALKYLRNNIITEGTEEIAADFLNDGIDILLNQHDAELWQKYNDYTSNGYTGKEAFTRLLGETLTEYAQSGAAGAIMGAGFAGVNAGVQVGQQAAVDRSIGRQIQEGSNAAAVIRAALESADEGIRKLGSRLAEKIQETGLPQDAETAAELQVVAEAEGLDANGQKVAAPALEIRRPEAEAVDAQQPVEEAAPVVEEEPAEPITEEIRTSSGAEEKPELEWREQTAEEAAPAEETVPEKVSPEQAKKAVTEIFKGSTRKLGKLYRKMMGALDVEINTKSVEEIKAAVQNRLKQLGEDVIDPVATAIAKLASGEQMTSDELDLLEASTVRQGVLNEVATSLIRNGGREYLSDETVNLMERRGTLQQATTAKGIKVAQKQTAAAPARVQEMVEETIAADEEGSIQARAQMLGNDEAAKTMINMAEGVTNTRAYAMAFEAAYDYGTAGIDPNVASTSKETTALTPEQFQAAYQAGVKAAAAPVRAANTGGKVTFAGNLGSRLNEMEGNQRAAINALRKIASVSTVNIEFFQSEANAEGKYTAENGSYDPKTNTIRIDVNAGRNNVRSANNFALLRVAGHELTHYIKAQNAEGYKALQDFVVKQLPNMGDKSFDALVAEKMVQQPELSYADAVEEVVANGCEMMLKDSTAIQQLAQENKGLFRRVRNWLRNFIASVKRAFRGVEAYSTEATLIKDLEGLQKLWDDALVQASRNVQQSTKKAAPAKTETAAKETAVQKQVYDAAAHIDKRTDENIEGMEPFFNAFDDLRGMFAYNMAGIIRNDVANSQPAAKHFVWGADKSQPDVIGEKRLTSDLIAQYKDRYNWSWDQMRKISDTFMDSYEQGKPIPNTMAMKRFELMIDDALTNGFTDLYGVQVAPAVDYIEAKANIEGSNRLGMQYTKDTPEGVAWMDYAFGIEDSGAKFSVRKPAERVGNLIAVHNLNATKLKKALNLGGFPMPSIAIAKKDIGHQGFGDISLVFGRETIDPKVNLKNKVYSADAWTPTFPRIEYEADPNVEKRVRTTLTKLGNSMERYLNERLRQVVFGIDEYLNRFEGEAGFIEYAMQNYGLKAAFLEDQGLHVDMVKKKQRVGKEYSEEAASSYMKAIDLFGGDMYEALAAPLGQIREQYGTELEKIRPGITKMAVRLGNFIRNAAEYQLTANQPAQYESVDDYAATERSIDERIDRTAFEAWVRELLDGIEGESGVYNNKPIFTDSGNRRSFASTHMPVTVENIAKAMATQGNTKNVAGFHDIKSLRAATARTFRDVAEMHKYEDRIQEHTEAEFDAFGEALNNRMYELFHAMLRTKYPNGNTGIEYTYAEDALGEIFLEMADGKYTAGSIQKTLSSYGHEVSLDFAEEIERLFDDVAAMPVNMFEAKPERAVGFDEVRFAVVPSDLDAVVRNQLSEVVPDVREYEAGNEKDRLQVLNSREDVKFSKRVDSEVASIRDQIASAKDALNSMEPVIDTDVALPDTRIKSASINWVMDTLKDIDGYVEREDFGKIIVDKRRIKRSLSYLKTDGEIAAFAALPDILRDGIQVGKHDDHKNHEFPTVTFAAPVVINGKRGNMAATVAITTDNFYKTHRIVMPDGSSFVYEENKNTEASPYRSNAENSTDTRSIESVSRDIVAQNDSESNKKFSIRTDILTDRDILADAFEEVAANDTERSYIRQYREKVLDLNEKEARLSEVRSQIREMMFTAGKRDAAFNGRLNQLKNEAKILADYVNKADKRLLGFENSKPLQNVLARERAKVEKQSAKKRKEAIATIRDRKNATEVRHKIKAVLDDFNRRLKNPTEKSYIPANMVQLVIAAEELIDTRSGREGEKAQAKLAALQGMYERYKSDATFAYVYDPVIADMLNSLSSVVGNKSIYQLNSAELQSVYETLKALKKQVTEAVQLKAGDYARSIIEAGREMIRETQAAAPLAKGKAGEFLNWQLTPDKFFARLAGFKKNSIWSKVAESFSKGTEKMLEIQRDHYYHFKKFTESKEFDKLNDQKHLVDIGLTNDKGETVKVTRGMMLSAYMHLSNEENARGFMYGGFSIPNLKAYYDGKVKESYGRGSANTRGTAQELYELAQQMNDPSLTEDQLAALETKHDQLIMEGMNRLEQMRNDIYSQMTQYEKDLVAAVRAWNDGKSQAYINDVTMDLYGIKKASVQNYFPIHRDTAFVNTDFASISRNVNLENWGSLKTRVPSQAPIMLTDIAYEMDSSLNQMSRYVGYARAQRDFNKLYNVRMPGMSGSVKKAVSVKFGTGAGKLGVSGEQYIENYIGSITGSRHGQSGPLSLIRRNLVRSTMTLNLRVGFSQLSAIPKAAAEVGWDSMFSGLGSGGIKAIFSKSDREDLAKQNAWFWQRYRGEGGQREFADAKGGNDIISKAWNKMDDITRGKLLNWCQNFDVMSTVSMWSMAKAWARKHTNYAEGSAEFIEAANKKYTDILRNTQAMSTTSEQSDAARTPGDVLNMFTMFKSEAFANFNLLYDAVAKLRKYNADFKAGANGVTRADVNAAKRHLAGAATSVILGASLFNALFKLLINALTHAVDGYRDDEDEITLESTLTAIGKEVASDTAGMVLLGGELYEFISAAVMGDKYYAPSDMALSEITEMLETIMKVAQDEDRTAEDVLNASKKLAFNLTNIMGVPAENMKRYWKGGAAWLEEAQEGTLGSWEGGVTRSNSTNYDRLYNAAITGDNTKFERVLAELIENGVEDKDAREGFRDQVKDAYKDGSITEDKAMSLLVSHGGKDKDEAFWTMEEWNYSGEGNYNKYADLRTALKESNANAAKAEIQKLTGHGVEEKTVIGELSTMYNNGEATTIMNLQLRSNNLYTSNLKLKTDKEVHKDDFDAFLTAVVNGSGVTNEVNKLYQKGYTTKQIMRALNGAFGNGSNRKTYQRMVYYNPSEAKVLLDRILNAYAAIGLDRNEEIAWINENWEKFVPETED